MNCAPIKSNILTPDWPLAENLAAAVTTRQTGNLACHVGDDPAAVLLRRRRLQRTLSLPSAVPWLTQQHTAQVSQWPNLTRPCDAIISQGEVPCAVLTADCLPILIASLDGQHIAAVHAGWRGFAAGVLAATIKQMPVAASQLMLWFGPAICQRCFQVGDEVRQVFAQQFSKGAIEQAFNEDKEPGKWRMNLAGLAEVQAKQLGVASVYQSGLCSHCDPHRWFSYRQQSTTGRFASIIWRKEP